MAKQKKKGGCGTIFWAIIVLGAIGIIFGDKDDKKEDIQVSSKYTESEKINLQKNTKEPETGIEVKTDFLYGDINDFDYEIVNGVIVLDSYNGKRETLEIQSTYKIDKTEYPVDVSEFQVGIGNRTVKTIIFDDGFTEINNSVFNSCDVQKVYFPNTLTCIYDNTLSYLHPEEGNKIQIYYGGTKDEWLNIFTEYKRTKVEDAEFGEEMGTALADKLNEMMGGGYDSSEFEYYFSANPEDLK